MVATTGSQRGARTLGSATAKSVPKGFRARDTKEWDFKFNGVVSKLQAKLDSGERLLRPVKTVKDVD